MAAPGGLRTAAAVLAVAGVAAGLFALGRRTAPPVSPFSPVALPSIPVPSGDAPRPPSSVPARKPSDPDAPGGYAFRPPSGQPASLSCAEARLLLKQVRASLAYAPRPVTPASLATATADWLDPHGLWSAAPDSPVAGVLTEEAGRVLAELGPEGVGPCVASRTVGAALSRWMHDLSLSFDAARVGALHAAAAPGRADAGFDAVRDAVFEDDGRTARDIATRLGERGGRLEHDVGPSLTPYVETARARFLPPVDPEGWAGAVRAATVRAYVGLVDPHGAWAPKDEEASVYDVDLDPDPPQRLWDDGIRTALGVRIEGGPTEPLEVEDEVLSVGGVALAGLPLEQIDELVYATTDAPVAAPLEVLRGGKVVTLELPPPRETTDDQEEASVTLPSYRVPYGKKDALVIEIHDVRSDLGDALAATLRAEEAGGAPPVAVLLDLRDDGGGSTEGAIAAISLFLPGAPLFPMARRDGSIEVDRAPLPPSDLRWSGPVATLVDSDTASAAEMIAGALLAYHRGAIVGRRTYGKGCAQEYIDDRGLPGVLRLTTLLYALPDGSPVQGVGLEPTLLLPAPRPSGDGSAAREADQPNAPPTWRGPDVRDPTLERPASAMSWPDHAGAVGPCSDTSVCQALRALGASGARRASALAPGPGSAGGRR